MAYGRHRAGRMPASQRRKLVWADSQATNQAMPLGGSNAIDLLSNYRTAGGGTQGVTIIRTHLSLVIASPAGALAGDGMVLGTMVSQAIGGAVSTADAYADWAYFTTLYNVSSGNVRDTETSFMIDIKSKRKCQEVGESYFLAYSATRAASAFSYHARTLLALP